MLVVQSCLILCNLMDCSLPDSSVMGFFRQEYWSGVPFHPPGDLLNPRAEVRSPILQADSLPSEPPGKGGLKDNFSLLGLIPFVYYAAINWMRKTEEEAVHKSTEIQNIFLDIVSLQ